MQLARDRGWDNRWTGPCEGGLMGVDAFDGWIGKGGWTAAMRGWDNDMKRGEAKKRKKYA